MWKNLPISLFPKTKYPSQSHCPKQIKKAAGNSGGLV